MAKAVALEAGDRKLLAVLPACYRINFRKLSAIAGAKVRLMDEDTFSELCPDCEPGVILPFGELYGAPVHLEVALTEDAEIIKSAGTRFRLCAHGERGFPALGGTPHVFLCRETLAVARFPSKDGESRQRLYVG